MRSINRVWTETDLTRIRREIGKLVNPKPQLETMRIAKWFVQWSAYWYDHQAGPTPAPGQAEHVTEGPYGFQLALGSNKFLVEQAIKSCSVLALSELDNCGGQPNIHRLRREMAKKLRCCVSNYADERIDPYPVDKEGHMHFGSNSIFIPDFVQFFLVQTEFIALKSKP